MGESKRSDRSRAAILAAADALFREQGLAATSMEQIAGLAGLTRKTIYNLFQSKEEIGLQLVALAESRDAGYRARMQADEDAFTLLRDVIGDSAQWCRSNPSLAVLALSPAVRPTVEPPTDRPSFQRLVRDIVALGQRQGLVLQDEDAGFMTLVLLGIYGQAMLSALSVARVDQPDIQRLLAMVFEGIGKRGSGAAVLRYARPPLVPEERTEPVMPAARSVRRRRSRRRGRCGWDRRRGRD